MKRTAVIIIILITFLSPNGFCEDKKIPLENLSDTSKQSSQEKMQDTIIIPGEKNIPNQNDSNAIGLNKDYFKNYIDDTGAIITSPLDWDNSDYIKALLIGGIAVGLYANDSKIQNWVQNNRNKTTNDISSVVTNFGNPLYTLPPIGLMYIYGIYAKDDKVKKVVLLTLESAAITGIFTQVVKFTGHRYRPNESNSSTKWDGPSLSKKNLSFFSGHSSYVFSIATVIASEYNENIIVPVLAYTGATLTALSRVNDNSHWASDVFVGSMAGYFIGKKIVNLHKKKEDKFIIIPKVMYNGGSAILIGFRF